MTDERGTVISDKRGNSNRNDNDRDEDERKSEKEGSGATPSTTLVFSLLLTLNTLIITYRPLIVFIISQNIQHRTTKINVAININPVSISYHLYAVLN